MVFLKTCLNQALAISKRSYMLTDLVDPLFGLMAAFKADDFDKKVDLGIGMS